MPVKRQRPKFFLSGRWSARLTASTVQFREAMGLSFVWNARNEDANYHKHGVSFGEAMTVFGDPLARTIVEPSLRITMGVSAPGRLLVVMHVLKGDTIEIAGAWLATAAERSHDAEADPDLYGDAP